MILSKAQKFQRMAELLARIQQQIEARGGDPAEVRRRLSDVVRRIGVDLEVVRLLDAETLTESLLGGGMGKLWGVAEVLYLDAIVALAEGREEEAAAWLVKARRLYQRVEPGLELPAGTPAPEERVRRIDSLLGAG